MEIEILKSLHDKLLTKFPLPALILGTLNRKNCFVAVDCIELPTGHSVTSTAEALLTSLIPSGIFIIGSTLSDIPSSEPSFNIPSCLASCFLRDSTHLLFVPREAQYCVVYFVNESDGSPKARRICSDTPVSQYLRTHQVLSTSLHLSLRVVHLPGEAKDWSSATSRSIDDISNGIEQDSATFLVAARGRQVLLSANSPGTVGELSGSPEQPLHCALLQSSQPPISSTPVPQFTYSPLPDSLSHLFTCEVRLSVLAYVPVNCALAELGSAYLKPALKRQLTTVRQLIIEQGKPVQISAHHFLLPGRAHYVTCLYPSLDLDPVAAEAALEPLRRELHELLALPSNRPLLRVASAVNLGPTLGIEAKEGLSGSGKFVRLRDVHLGVPSPGGGGRVSLVRGSYEYCHYMQERVNDNGWGCAYRSLQTLISWFREQHFTAKPIPSHREIQAQLVQLGDKPATFVGGREWIGAVELGFVMDAYLGVTCRFVTVNDSADIPSKARELAAHFDTHGTPVMIGGGVLAYTLLGVSFNESTGDTAFLILDPHYTGGEDLKRIQGEGWIAWRRPGDSAAAGGPLFAPRTFYNFLCPQLPSVV